MNKIELKLGQVWKAMSGRPEEFTVTEVKGDRLTILWGDGIETNPERFQPSDFTKYWRLDETSNAQELLKKYETS